MRRIRLPGPVVDIYRAVQRLEAEYPDRKFTPDGHMVGSIGEVIAKEAFGLELHPMSFRGHDARDADGRDVQIKLTAGASISMYAICDRLIVLKIISPEEAAVIYDGDGTPIWNAAGPLQKNGQRSIRLSKIQRISQQAA